MSSSAGIKRDIRLGLVVETGVVSEAEIALKNEEDSMETASITSAILPRREAQ